VNAAQSDESRCDGDLSNLELADIADEHSREHRMKHFAHSWINDDSPDADTDEVAVAYQITELLHVICTLLIQMIANA